MRRVVVTGMGIACPLGLGVENVWSRLIAGESGITAIQTFDVSELSAKIAGTFARFRAQRVAEGAPEGQVKDPILAVDAREWGRLLAAAAPEPRRP